MRPLSPKKPKVNWTEGVAQAVEILLCRCLLFKLKALSSNPSPTKKKKLLVKLKFNKLYLKENIKIKPEMHQHCHFF
jgi:hypothetical protein